jgi:Ni2+-binding GTPase involved in maturation of urease and hydrogenase
MLISGAVGMGKYTVQTQPSKEIKKKFPTKCVISIDINDHTDVPNTQQQKLIDKEKATEFFWRKC